MKFRIKKKFPFHLLYETEASSFKEAVEKAVKERVNLTNADLTNADLTNTNLTNADLTNADLTNTNFTNTNLTNADLTNADLTSANFTNADLTNTNFTYADLTYADLRGSNFISANWNAIKRDMTEKMALMPNEVPYMYKAIHGGKVNGSVYEGECACFCGTLANAKNVSVNLIPIKKDSNSPVERFFFGIQEGDTPHNNPLSKLAAEWIEEFCKERGIALPKRRVVWE